LFNYQFFANLGGYNVFAGENYSNAPSISAIVGIVPSTSSGQRRYKSYSEIATPNFVARTIGISPSAEKNFLTLNFFYFQLLFIPLHKIQLNEKSNKKRADAST
ncbi:MAG: hypothetical protein MJZ61_08125, partial [Bacteroidales bacterium]|nr:hypothetical protein [Bacteroidales bacterium]